MMRLLKIAKSGLGGRPAGEDEARGDEHERERGNDAPLDVAAADNVREDEPEADETGEVSSSDDNSDASESEIGAILAMIGSRRPGDNVPGDLPEETGATYRLLSELDRIWRSA